MINFHVISEHTFVYVNPRHPNECGILASSVIRGSNDVTGLDGTLNWPRTDSRPATRSDFDTFRVSIKGYENDANYNVPTE